jgi:hyperosmotically inducible periplasmic protein
MRNFASLMSVTLALACASAFAQDKAATDSSKRSGAADTSATSPSTSSSTSKSSNAADSSSKSSNAADRKLLADVRKAVVNDKTLSKSAHNVKMTTNGGVVTLRGDVRSDEEKSKIESLAKGVSGVSSVENNLQVKAETASRKGTADRATSATTDSGARDSKTKTN